MKEMNLKRTQLKKEPEEDDGMRGNHTLAIVSSFTLSDGIGEEGVGCVLAEENAWVKNQPFGLSMMERKKGDFTSF